MGREPAGGARAPRAQRGCKGGVLGTLGQGSAQPFPSHQHRDGPHLCTMKALILYFAYILIKKAKATAFAG